MTSVRERPYVRVLPVEDGWEVIHARDHRRGFVYDDIFDALGDAREAALEQGGGRVVLLNRSGKIALDGDVVEERFCA